PPDHRGRGRAGRCGRRRRRQAHGRGPPWGRGSGGRRGGRLSDAGSGRGRADDDRVPARKRRPGGPLSTGRLDVPAQLTCYTPAAVLVVGGSVPGPSHVFEGGS